MAELPMLVAEDWWKLRFVTQMQPAPNGRGIAFTVEWNDQEANETHSAIWLCDLLTGQTRRLTAGQKRDRSPRWSPDSRQLAFVSTRDGAETQIYLLQLEGGDAQPLTRMRRGADEPFWSADGRWIGFESEVRPGDTPTAPDTRDVATRKREEKDEAERPHIYTRTQYRWDGKGYLEGRKHLFRVWLEHREIDALTEGDFDSSNGSCSPDGRWLAFISDRTANRDANMATDLYLQSLEDGDLRCLTGATYAIGRPTWSRDSRYVAAFGSPIVAEHAAYNTALLVASAQGGEVSNLLAGQDVSALTGLYGDVPGPDPDTGPVWSEDGQHIYFVSQRRGGSAVLRAPAPGDAPAEDVILEPNRHIAECALLQPASGSRCIITLSASPTELWDIWKYAGGEGAGAGAPERVTHSNADFMAGHSLVTPSLLRCPSFDGHEMEGWLYRPPKGAAPAPLVLIIHGGPHGAYGESFMLRAQVLAGRGYAALYANPRGSTGYGEAFMQACDHDWGGGDYQDLMSIVDAALAQGDLDPARLGVTGASYGGYMTNWIIGQTHRFAAAVTVHSVSSLASCFGTGDIDSFSAEGDYGWPWEQETFYRERSPLTYAEHVRTPVRIIAAENDYRCPISQSEEYYTWLKQRSSVPVELVRLPNASHQAYASPRQRVSYLNLVFEWLEHWIPVEPRA